MSLKKSRGWTNMNTTRLTAQRQGMTAKERKRRKDGRYFFRVLCAPRGQFFARKQEPSGLKSRSSVWSRMELPTFTLPDYQFASYAFEIAARPNGGFAVKEERLEITAANGRLTANVSEG